MASVRLVLGAGEYDRVIEDADELLQQYRRDTVSYTHLRAHETVLDLVCRLLLENKKNKKTKNKI